MSKEFELLKTRLLKNIHKLDKNLGFFEEKETIILGISGGFDSLVLADLLSNYRKKYNIDFNVVSVFVNNQFKSLRGVKKIQKFLQERDITFKTIKDEETKKIILDKSMPFNPCFICSRRRKKALLEFAQYEGANKIVLGHTLDDAIETFLLNTFFARELSTILPKQPLFRGAYFILRPLIFINKKTIKKYASFLEFRKKLEGTCPFAKNSKREMVRNLLKKINENDPEAIQRAKHALFNYNNDFLWSQYKEIKDRLL